MVRDDYIDRVLEIEAKYHCDNSHVFLATDFHYLHRTNTRFKSNARRGTNAPGRRIVVVIRVRVHLEGAGRLMAGDVEQTRWTELKQLIQLHGRVQSGGGGVRWFERQSINEGPRGPKERREHVWDKDAMKRALCVRYKAE